MKMYEIEIWEDGDDIFFEAPDLDVESVVIRISTDQAEIVAKELMRIAAQHKKLEGMRGRNAVV